MTPGPLTPGPGSPSPAAPRPLGLPLSSLFALLVTVSLVAGLAPGRSDLPNRALAGTEAADDGYWTAPLRRVAGTGRQDAFDERLALSLALPENALGALAWRLGVPAADARFAGSVVALFASLLAALLLGGLVPAFFLALLLATPPILGHLRTDLGEGTAFGLVSLFGLAIVRGRVGLAAFLAGVGIFQKACGLPLGVGVLAAVLAGPGRATKFGKAALGTVIGVGLATAVAMLVFGDDPVAFVVRPFTATRDTGAGIDGKSFLLRAAFPGAYDVGYAFLWIAAAAWVALPHRIPPPALVAALLAGFAFSGAFPDPWRALPTWMLLPSLLARPRDEAPRIEGAGRLLSACLVAQAVVGAAAWHAPGPRTLLALAVVFLGLDLWRARAPASRWTALPLAIALGVASVVLLPPTRITTAHDVAHLGLAERVATRLPADAHLIGYSFFAAKFRGTLYYPPFQSLWERELDASDAPSTLYRVRAANSKAPPPKGYASVALESLGRVPYGRTLEPGEVVLETLRRR